MNGISLLAIDPGFTESAFVFYDGERPTLFGKWPNATFLRQIQVGLPPWPGSQCVIEWVGHYGTGMSAGAEVFETCRWAGRFEQAWYERQGGDKFCLTSPQFVKRQTVKTHVCGKAAGNDANIRQAMIDRYGGDSVAIGGKKCQACKGKCWTGREHKPCECGNGWQFPPGPLRDITKDVWQALALAVCYWDQHIEPLEAKP